MARFVLEGVEMSDSSSELLNRLLRDASHAQPALWGNLIREVARKQERKNIILIRSEGGFRGNTKYAYLSLVQRLHEIQSDASVYFLAGDNVVRLLRANGLPALSTETNWQQSALMALNAKIVIKGTHDFVNANNWFWQSCFEGALKLQLWHGIPVKKGCATMLETRPDYYSFAGMIYDTHLTPIVIAESRLCKKSYSEDWPNAQVLAFGASRNDILVSKNNFGEFWRLGIDAKIFSALEKEKALGKRIILCCPTYREAHDDPGLFIRNWFSAISHMTTLPDATVCFKTHPIHFNKHPNDLEKLLRFCMDWGVLHIPPLEDIHPYYLISDALVTDYSSTYMDYMILKHPIIFFRPDTEQYQKTRNLRIYNELNLEKIGPICRNSRQLVEAVATELKQPSYTQEMEKYAVLFHRNAKDGKATKRLCNLVEWLLEQDINLNGKLPLKGEDFYDKD